MEFWIAQLLCIAVELTLTPSIRPEDPSMFDTPVLEKLAATVTVTSRITKEEASLL